VKLHRWREFPRHVREHLVERLTDRKITAADLEKRRAWVDSQPEVPTGDWYKDFGRFKICGTGPNPTTFLTEEQVPWGQKIAAEADEADA